MPALSFEMSLRTYVEIDDELKRISSEAKSLRSNKAALESAISSHMVDNEINEHKCLDTSRVKIYTKKSSKSAYNKAGVYDCAQILFGSEKADALLARIEERKNVTESTALKRIGVPHKTNTF